MTGRRIVVDKADINTLLAALQFYENEDMDHPEPSDDELHECAPSGEVFEQVEKLRTRTQTFTTTAVNTMIAALTHYRDENQGEPDSRDDEIHELATGGEEFEDISYDEDGINGLIERITKTLKWAHHPTISPEDEQVEAPASRAKSARP